MKIRRKYLAVLVPVSYTMIFLSWGTESQTEQQGLIQIRRIATYEPLVVPGLSKSRIVKPRQRVDDQTQETGGSLFATVYKPEMELEMEIPFYLVDRKESSLKIESHSVRVDSIARYEFKEATFCFVVYGVSVLYSADKKRGGYGPMWEFHYCDSDGDGRLDTIEHGKTRTPRIPTWARKPIREP